MGILLWAIFILLVVVTILLTLVLYRTSKLDGEQRLIGLVRKAMVQVDSQPNQNFNNQSEKHSK